MHQLLNRLKELGSIASSFDADRDHMRSLINTAADFTIDFIEELPVARSFVQGEPDRKQMAIDGVPKGLDHLLAVYRKEVVELGIKAASGGHMGYIPGGGLYASAVADYLAATTNEYAGVAYASPGAAAMEREIIDWFKDIFGFPESAVGNLASGGSIANLIAILAARDKYGVKNERVRDHVVYLGNLTHHCIYKALRIAGLEDVIIRKLDPDANGKLDPDAFSHLIAQDKADNLVPFLVIASAGTTDTGVVDPLHDIGTIARDQDLWFHIDAAYGGFFILTDEKKQLFKGIELADSLVIDPHKGMFLPYGIGAVLVREKSDALRSFRSSANYMQDAVNEEGYPDPADISPELTKHFRALRLWLPLQLYGIEPFTACLEEKLVLTRIIRIKLADLGFELGPEPDLSVTYFWYPTDAVDQDKFNRKLMEFIHRDGSVFLSSTTLNGRFVIRIAILSFRTKLATIESCVQMIQSCLEKTRTLFLEQNKRD